MEPVTALWLSGAIRWVVVYSARLGITAAVSEQEYRQRAVGYAAIPVVGWAIMLADVPMYGWQEAAVAASGVLELAAVGLFIGGLIYKRPVRESGFALGNGPQAPRFSVRVGSFVPWSYELRLTVTHL